MNWKRSRARNLNCRLFVAYRRDHMLKEMDSKLEEVQKELDEKERVMGNKIKEHEGNEKKLRLELHEVTTDCQKFKDLYDSSMKNIKNFKS